MSVGGQRVTHFQGYLDQVDWTDADHVRRALRVFEIAIKPMFADAEARRITEGPRDRIRRLFANDSITVTDDGQFEGGPVVPAVISSLGTLTDPRVIEEHLDRFARAIVSQDPAQAIGSAKELIESTAKLVLATTGHKVTGREELPELVKEAECSASQSRG